jgi:hypothetical protein
MMEINDHELFRLVSLALLIKGIVGEFSGEELNGLKIRLERREEEEKAKSDKLADLVKTKPRTDLGNVIPFRRVRR